MLIYFFGKEVFLFFFELVLGLGFLFLNSNFMIGWLVLWFFCVRVFVCIYFVIFIFVWESFCYWYLEVMGVFGLRVFFIL